MVCEPVIEDLEVLIMFLPHFNEGDMASCKASSLACSGFFHATAPERTKGRSGAHMNFQDQVSPGGLGSMTEDSTQGPSFGVL